MGLLNYLVATRRRIFDLVNGTNQLATVADVNSVVDSINKSNSATYNFSSLVVSNPFGLPMTVVANGGACVSGGTGCWSCLNTCQYKDYVKATTFTETAPGVFRLVLDITTPVGGTPISKTSVRVNNFAAVNVAAAVNQVSPGVWDITTYDTTTGVAGANLFSNTFIDIIYYYDPFVPV